jgi:hypothetical protein
MSFEAARAAWDLAGFTDDESRLGKPVPTGDLLVPNTIALDSEKRSLLWVPKDGLRRVQPTRRTLNDFVRLWDAPPAAILRYARAWGVLHVDDQGTPGVKAYTVPRGDPSERVQLLELRRSEPLDAWRYFSRRACAVFNIAASLKIAAGNKRDNPRLKSKRASPDDWAALDGLERRIGSDAFRDLWRRRGILELYARVGCPYSAAWDVDKERRWLEREIMLWLEIGRPAFAVNERSWRLEVDYNGCLFAAIALQLALHVTGARNLFICSECGFPYVREKERKAPKSGQANYCLNCKVPLRRANERLREKVAEARRLRAEGNSLREIAKRLNVRTTKRSTALQTVRRWVGKGE